MVVDKIYLAAGIKEFTKYKLFPVKKTRFFPAFSCAFFFVLW